ncbi:MAG: GNAT family N-acetyltransferase [Candidatus Daviesbacteria bacterium]|nr:GNAT family N-acetyltransferase [Candidatus Daviesbacteria bacterium]
MSGQIVFQGKIKNELDILVRYPQSGDAQQMCEYINTLSSEKTFILFQGEQTSLEDEQKYLDSQLKKFEDKKTTMLLVFNENKLIGISGIELKDKAEKHIGGFGISIAKDFRGKGIGTFLTDVVIKEAEKNLQGLKIIILGVFGDNKIAQGIYKKFGFLEYGNLPEGILHADVPVDHIYMYKKVV